MSSLRDAPGKPGIPPTWTSSRKDMVITSLGTSQIWATLGYGILNEVYWPSTGQPQIRDLGFIVARDGEWWEIKRLNHYELTTPRPYILMPHVLHRGDDFTLSLEFVCDDSRNVVLIRYNLQGEGCRLYPLLAPRLGSHGRDNTAWCEGGEGLASGDTSSLCLSASSGFTRLSAGYVGSSDGWRDFHEHGRMTWEYEIAELGNVALLGELAEQEGVLALGLSMTTSGARTLARSSLAEGFPCISNRVRAQWEAWGENLTLPADLDDRFRCQVEHSTAVLKTCEDRTFPGAAVASLSIPWGNSRDDLGGYHLVWARDSVESALAMIAVGNYTAARQLLAYLIATQLDDGHWMQNFFPDGTPYWQGVQLDETSFPVLLAAKLWELGELDGMAGVERMVYRALGFLLRAGPVSPQDRWEENEGLNPFTLAFTVAAIVGGAPLLAGEDECKHLLSYADYLNRRIEDWVYTEESELARKYGVAGHYLRIASCDAFLGDTGEVILANGGGRAPAREVVSLDYLYLARLGLRRPDDPRMNSTLAVVEGELRRETPSGPCYYRYTGDGYGEHADGTPFDGTGIGRLWPLLTGERGHLALQLGEDPTPYLHAMCNMTGIGGLLPEQVWDCEPIPERQLYPGKPTGSAMPLLWAHAEYVKLAIATSTGRPVELLDAVSQRYGSERPEPATWHWRTYAPFAELPAGVNLLIEAPQPFLLHYGFAGWSETEDRQSVPLGFDMHGVRFTAKELRGRESVHLTLHYNNDDTWEQFDHVIRLDKAKSSEAEHTESAETNGQAKETRLRSKK